MKFTIKTILSFFVICILNACTEELPGVGSIEDKTPPSADFTYKSDQSTFSLVHFSNTSISASEFSWDFGGGNTSDEKEPSFDFGAEGSYDVMLTAKDGNGLTSSITITVDVVQELVPEFGCPSFQCSTTGGGGTAAEEANWNRNYSVTQSPTPPDGTDGVKFTSSKDHDDYIEQTIAVAPNTTYKVGFFHVSKAEVVCAEVLMTDPDNSVTFVDEDLMGTSSASAYVAQDYVFTTTANTNQLTFRLSPIGAVEFRVDLVTIVKVE